MTRRNHLFGLIVLLGVVGLLLAAAGSRWANSHAAHAADLTAEQMAQSDNGLLSSELQKFRLLPLVLAEHPDALATLAAPNEAAARRFNEQLELLARRTDAAVIYLIDSDGRTRAASNWDLPTSFVGQNYGFRPYFREAMRNGSSELFALGTVSGRPGLYLARRVESVGRALGTIVVKVEFDKVEESWRRAPGITFVTDTHGVILITSIPAWRFGATSALDAKTLAAARASLQFGANPPHRVRLSLDGQAAVAQIDGRDVAFRVARVDASLADGRLYHLSPLAPALSAARTQALLWALGALLVAGAVIAWLARQSERQRMMQESQAALEREVNRQTAELRDANVRLVDESRQREEANARFERAREDLARANRLGTLGQITAGVAHEINQPVAAIRTFAENSTALLDRGQAATARQNLSRIVTLTERIGTITSELRSFTRRKTPSPVQAELGSILDGALLLIGEAGREQVKVHATKAQRQRVLAGDRVRLEQVLINLLRNALDAVHDRSDPHVGVVARERAGFVELKVEDNGPGVDCELQKTLFNPFESAKPGGLGLGLAIARDIAREFGGDLLLKTTSGAGSVFLFRAKIAA